MCFVNSSFCLETYFIVNDVSVIHYWSMHVIKLFDVPCIEYVCVTKCKDPKEELLRALQGASRWQCSDDPCHDRHGAGIGAID